MKALGHRRAVLILVSLSIGLLSAVESVKAKSKLEHSPSTAAEKHLSSRSHKQMAAKSNGHVLLASKTNDAESQHPEKSAVIQRAAQGKSIAPNAPKASSNDANSNISVAQAGELDSALQSLLRDLSKAIKQSDYVSRIENQSEKAALTTALATIDQAATRSGAGNRIVPTDNKERLANTVSAQSWESGEMKLADGSSTSMNILWARKVNGLINITVTGTTIAKGDSDDRPIEFAVVVNGKSSIDSGFDIQSQTEVAFWLGKLTNFSIDAGIPEAPQTVSGQKKTLHALITNNCQRALQVLSTQIATPSPASPAVSKASDNAASFDRALPKISKNNAHKTVQKITTTSEPPKRTNPVSVHFTDAMAASAPGSDSIHTALPLYKSALSLAELRPPHHVATYSDISTDRTNTAEALDAIPPVNDGPATAISEERSSSLVTQPSSIDLTNTNSAQSGLPASGAKSNSLELRQRTPANTTRIIAPERAVAGENLTVTVISGKENKPESFVSLSFNGSLLTTDGNGRATYQIPEEAPPGQSLRIAIDAKPDCAPVLVNIHQPLAKPEKPEKPRIDHVSGVAIGGGIITIDGHNFSGAVEENHVILDARQEAKILVSSPVQIKFALPQSISTGNHAITVSSNGATSNAGQCETVAIQVQPLGKAEKTSKWTIKVVGTQSKVRVRLINDSPDLVKLTNGKEQTMVTTGGSNNLVTLNAQRLARGPIRLTTVVEPLQ